MSTITKELAKLFRKITNSEIDAEGNAHVVLSPADSLLINNARIALASLEAEPVCVIDQSNLDYLKSGSDADVWPASRAEMGDVLLYRAAPPAQVVPDLKELETILDWILMLPCPTPKATHFAKRLAVVIDTCRAAMLHGADGNSPVIAKAYDIEAFGIFSANEGEDGLLLQIEQFLFGTENCPQIGKENMVPKFALQAIINRLQAHCNSMGEDTLIDIFASSAAPQQEDK